MITNTRIYRWVMLLSLVAVVSCGEETVDLKVEKLFVDRIVNFSSDSLYLEGTTGFVVLDSSYLVTDMSSNMVKFTSEFEVADHKNIKGKGPGQAMAIAGFTTDQQNLFLMDATSMTLKKYGYDLEHIRDIPLEGVFPVMQFEATMIGDTLITTQNATNDLITRILVDGESAELLDPILKDITFQDQPTNPMQNHYNILHESGRLILAATYQPVVMIIDYSTGEIIAEYDFSKVGYLKETIEQKEIFYKKPESKGGMTIITDDMYVSGDNIYLLVLTQWGRYSFSNSLLKLRLVDDQITPEKILQLNNKTTENVPWITDFIVIDNQIIAFNHTDGSFFIYEL